METLVDLMPRVRSHARWVARRAGVDEDEVESAAMLGLAVGWNGYDEAHGGSRAAHCWYRAKLAIVDCLRVRGPVSHRGKIRPMQRSLNATIITGNGDEERLDYMGVLQDPHDGFAAWESAQHVEWLFRGLGARQRRIMDAVVDGDNFTEIAAREGISDGRVGVIARESMARIRAELRFAA